MSDPPVPPPPEERAPGAAPSKRQFPFSSRKPPRAPPSSADADHEPEGIVVRTPPTTPPASAAADHETAPPPPLASASRLPLKQKSYAADHEAESNEWNSSHGHLDVVDSPAQTSISGEAGKGKKTSRTIGVLTKKFVDMIKHAEDGISVKEAAETLEVEKRRIYDVTNVLEGIGLIEKTPENKFQWKQRDVLMPGEPDDNIDTLQAEVGNLTREDRRLEEQIRVMEETIKNFRQDENNQKWLFVTEDDIKSLPCFHNQALIAIKAPYGTTIEVPDPDEAADFPQRRHRIILTSPKGAIDFHPVSQFEIQDVEPPPSFPSTSGTEEIQRVEAPPSYPSTSGIEETRATTTVVADSRGKGIQMQGEDNQPTRADLHTSLNIFPSNIDTNADYWLFSDRGVSITDMFGREVEVEWSEFGALSPSTSGIEEIQGAEVPPSYPPTSGIWETRATTTVMTDIRGKAVQMQEQDDQPTCADLNTSQDFTSETMPIFPSHINTNADYWLFSDPGGSITDMFCPEAVSDWVELGPLSHEDHVVDNVSMPQHQTSPSNTTSLSLELNEFGELPDDYLTDNVSSPPDNTTGVPPATNTSPADGKSP